MDFALDFYFGPAPAPASTPSLSTVYNANAPFIYDDPRFFSKLYVFLKSLGFLFYITTLPRCDNPLFFIIMNGMMCLSTVNSARYEYRHYQRYGTVFSRIREYEAWKVSLWPKTRIVFSTAELAIKIGYFIYTFPPRFAFTNACDAGKTVFMIHVLTVIGLYFILSMFTCWIYCCVCYSNGVDADVDADVDAGAGAGAASFRANVSIYMASYRIPLASPTTFVPQDKECCICLNSDESLSPLPWVELPCKHIFHRQCVSRWLLCNNTCPICRDNVRVM